MAVDREQLDLDHKQDRVHFGRAEEEAYRLGGVHALERLGLTAEEFDVVAALAEALTEGRHRYDPTDHVIYTGEPESETRWHSLGTFAMVRLLGHSHTANNLGAVIDELIDEAVERDRVYRDELEQANRAAEAARIARDEELFEASLREGWSGA